MKALAVAAGIVFWTLALGVAVLVLFPGGDLGEPVTTLQIDPAPPGAPAGGEADATTMAPGAPGAPPAGGVDLPPGFSVTGPAQPQAPMLAPPGQGTTVMPVTPGQLNVNPPTGPEGSLPQGPDRRGEAPAAEDEAVANAGDQPPVPQPQQAAAAAMPGGGDATGSISLIPVPVAALVEKSQYGPLPKIAADGRRPTEVYARPSPKPHATGGKAQVAVLVNGLGIPGGADIDVIKGLPPPVSVAYGAYGRGLQEWVTKARADGHEILLAIPLEPDNYPTEDPGPHTLLTTLPPNENIKRLHWLMSRYTGYVGITNHMGARFETTQASFKPVLEEVKRRGLLYIDDGSVEGSAGGQIAGVIGLEYSTAHVRLDEGTSAADLAKALAQLEALAKQQGAAIGIAKAEPDTVRQIADWAGKLDGKGLVLVPVSAAVRSQRQS